MCGVYQVWWWWGLGGGASVIVCVGGVEPDGKMSVSSLLLVVHSSYHHDPPMGQSSAPSTAVSVGVWIPDMIGEMVPPREGGRRMKDETSPVTY